MALVVNRIVTRGMGRSRGEPGRAGLVTQGFGGPPSFVLEALRRGVRVGGGGTRRRLRELQPVIVWARLVEVNDRPPARNIEGFVRVHVDKNNHYAAAMAEHVSTRVKKAWQDLKITVKRLR